MSATQDPLGNVVSLLEPTPYRARSRIGRGGMGDVYLVEHQFLGKRFALKVLRTRLAADAELADRMRLEAQSLGRLHHPHVVDVVDFWMAPDGRPCVVMELLEGRTLAEELAERGRLPGREAAELTCQALSALGAAHAIGIVHRDVKPENLFLHQVRGYGRSLKVLDFGFARVLPEAPSEAPHPLSLPTATGSLVGSPRFMSPEALRGERVDGRADLFSAGMVLYLLLAGHGPFDAGSDEPEPPSRHALPGATPELDAVVLRAIRERPEARYQAAEDFALELKAAARLSVAPSSTRLPSPTPAR